MPPSTLAPATASERRKFGIIAPIRPSAPMAVIGFDLLGISLGAKRWRKILRAITVKVCIAVKIGF